jgi:universal stress protein A
MYERVLIPLDGSELAETILPFAEHVAGPLDAEVLLLQVVEPPSPIAGLGTGGIIGPDALFLRQVEAKRYLDAVAGRLQPKGLARADGPGPGDAGVRDRGDGQGRAGRSDRHDHPRAERAQAGDLRIGGGGGLAERGHPSARDPEARAHVGAGGGRAMTIVHPTDFSESAEYAEQQAVRLAHAIGGEVILLHVAVESPLYREGLLTAKEVREVYEAARKWATGALEARVEKIREHGLATRWLLRTGVPHEVIARVATEEGADYIVIGTRGRGGLERALLGSVADRVVRTAPCPVVTVRLPAP